MDAIDIDASRRIGQLPSSITELLQCFFESLTRADFASAAALWAAPALLLGDHHVHGLMSLPQLERLLAETWSAPPKLDLPGDLHVEQVEQLSARVLQARVRWPSTAFDGALAGIGCGSFVLRSNEHGLLEIRSLFLLSSDPRVLVASPPGSSRSGDF